MKRPGFMLFFPVLLFYLVFHSGISFSAPAAMGEQRAAIILVDLGGKREVRRDREHIRKAIFDSEYSIANFFKEASYGKTTLGGDVLGWFEYGNRRELSWEERYGDSSFFGHGGFRDSGEVKCELSRSELMDLTRGEINYKKYNRVMVLYHRDEEKCSGMGHSTLGLETFRTPSGIIEASFTSVFISNKFARPDLPYDVLSGVTSPVIAHEFGHALGIRGHGNLLDCGGKALDRNHKNCRQEAIADNFTIMRGESFSRSAVDFNACHKEDLGWFDKKQLKVIKVKKGNSYKIKLYPYSHKNRTVALKILLKEEIPVTRDKSVRISALYLTYRTAEGFDRFLSRLEEEPLEILQKRYQTIAPSPRSSSGKIDISTEGIMIRGGFFLRGHCITTYLFDAHPDSIGSEYQGKFRDFSLYDSFDSMLLEDETFLEPYNDFKVRTLGKNADGSMTVEITKS